MVEFEGSYVFDAPRDLIWSMLHDPAANRSALPGGERFTMSSPVEAQVTLSVALGPLRGVYNGKVTVVDAQMPHTFSLALKGTGEGIGFSGEGRFAMSETDGRTQLEYTGQVAVTDPLRQISPRLLQTTANALVRQYLEAIAAQARAQMGLPPEVERAERPSEAERHPSTIDMGAWLAEMRRDRNVTLTIVVLAALASLSLIGAAFIASRISRWSTRRQAQDLGEVEE
jgi:carbon monoxide dehydrogenase subunit G